LIGGLWQGQLRRPAGLALLVGIAGIGAWAVITPDEFKAFLTGRQARFSTVAVFSSLLLIGIVAITFVFLQRGAVTLDMTENQRYTLTQQSFDVLSRVTRPIMITGFYSPRALAQREVDDQFFRLYEVATSGLIQRQYIDPQEQPATAQQFGVTEDAQVFISYLTDNGQIDFSRSTRVPLGNTQERDMTNAIARLLVAGTITVYFEQGRGERNPLDDSLEGISGVNNGMRETGFNTFPLDIRVLGEADEDIPEDAAAVIFARPTSDLTPGEIGVIQRYLARGGSLMLLADAQFTDNAFMSEDGAFNQFLWDNYGIRARDLVVVDPASRGTTALDVIGAAVFTQNEIAARLQPEVSPTLFRIARAVEADLTRSSQTITVGQVILSSEQSYGETDLATLAQTNTYFFDAATDQPGPFPLVVWSRNRETDARILLIGDSDFMSNGLVLTGDNGVLFTDGLAWLVDYGRNLAFGFQGYATGLPLVFVEAATLNVITFMTVLLLPGLVLMTGIIVWWRRSRR
jgi:ABC-type uncharacterized transport system involved in gliding motility auxiliary subunit